MLTKNDIQKLTEIFITRVEFEAGIETLATKEGTKKSMDRVYDLVDKVLGEVKAMRYEQSAHQQQHYDIDARFEKIEMLPIIAHELKSTK